MPTSKIQIVETGICPDTFDDTQLPTDVHIVTFTKDGVRQFDAVRAYTKVDIFDEYYDKLGKDNLFTLLKAATVALNQSYMAKSKVKTDYINDLVDITKERASKLTVKQLRQLIAKHAQAKLIWVTPDAEALSARLPVSQILQADNPEVEKLIKYLIKHKHWSPFEVKYMRRDPLQELLQRKSCVTVALPSKSSANGTLSPRIHSLPSCLN